jgi:hypothetical protein
LHVVSIEIGPLKVFLSERDRLKVAGGVKNRGVLGDVGTYIGHGDSRDLRLNEGTLGRIVIDKDEAIGAEVEVFCDRKNVLVFGLPVGLESGEMFEFENGVGMVESLFGNFFIVFRADCKEDASLA